MQPAFLPLVVLLSACLQLSYAQCVAQPTIAALDPPLGTTGNDQRGSTFYTLTGQQLDEVADVFVMTDRNLSTLIRVRNSTSIGFYIQNARLIEPDVATGVLILVPTNPSCSTANITVTLFPTVNVALDDRPDGQPGTVVFVVASSCVPPQCGDNSTTFDLMIGQFTLERLSTQTTTLKYAGRIPDFEGDFTRREVQMVTQYQTFMLSSSLQFNLDRPVDITSVTPSVGQRGTNVAVSVNDDDGLWANVDVFRVRLGETDADITDSSNLAAIQVRARSSIPGTANVRINTTQMFEGVMFNGPYTLLENGWTQLMDGNITEIIPQAAQQGRNILLCGNNLLGGGTSITLVQHGNSALLNSQSTPTSSDFLQSTECLEVQIPENLQAVSQNIITITSNTGATVLSSSNFSISSISSVNPSRGQVGTIVTISGQGLLSGYNSATPIVVLSQVLATVLRSSESEIVVQAGAIPVRQPQVINETTGATASPPQIIGVMGSILIMVTSPFNSSLTFNVTSSTGWQYEEPGVIDTVVPSFGQVGTLLTINGSNLLAYGTMLTYATIGGVNATIADGATDSLVQLTVPNTGRTGMVSIMLFSDSGAVVRRSNALEIRESGLILNVEPNQGQNGTFVRISGTNLFGHGQDITSVLFGDVPATVIAANNTVAEVRVQADTNTVDAAVAIRIIADTSAIVSSVNVTWTFLVPGRISVNIPQEGQVGTIVTIDGTNLLGGGDQISEIFLDGVSGTITSSNSSRIVVVMNDLLTQQTGFFPGQVYIVSNTGAVVFGGTYTHRASGIISSFSPARGRRGTVVTIVGMNVLGFGSNLSSVEIAGVSSTLMTFSNNTIVVAAGMGATNLTGPVVIRVDTGATITSSTNFTFDEPGVVNSVTPIQGAEGTGVLIRGSGLIPANVQLTNVTVGEIPVSRVVTASNQEISIIVGPAPSSNPENAEILITASDGSFVSGIAFSFINLSLSLPRLTSGQEGTVIEVSLPDQFDPLQATIDDLPATILSMNQTQRRISISVPRARRHGTFAADVAVEDANGVIARLRNAFTYLAEGLICDVQPTTGQLGTNVLIRGENLRGGGSTIDSATVVGRQAMVMSANDTVIEVKVLENAGPGTYPQLGDIVITADTGAVVRRLNSFSLVMPGTISQVTPSIGQNRTRVSIMGTDLVQGGLALDSVTLAGIPATVIGTPTDTLITLEASESSSMTQPSPIVVTLSSRATITSPASVTFQYLSAGDIDTLTPNSSTVGTRVVIAGTNLLQGGSTASSVTLGGVAAMLTTTISDTSIEVIARAGNISNTRDVVIISNTGSTLTGTGLWTYETLGVISSVSPSVGQAGIIVTISGQSLLGSASRFSSCMLAGVPGVIEGGFNDTTVRCRVGVNVVNRMNVTGQVQLMTGTGVTITSDSSITFTYYAAYIDNVSPSQGNNGTSVTISGSSLFTSPDNSFQLSRVLFGNLMATVISSSANEIRIQVPFSASASVHDSIRIESTSGSFLELQNAWNFTRPGLVQSVEPPYGLPGDTILLQGQDLAPAGATSVRVITGQTEAFNAQVVNASTIEFQAGVYQARDNPDENLPVQIIFAPTGQTHFFSDVVFRYNATSQTANSISPQAGSEGSMATITGTGFPNSTSNLRVTLAGVLATVQSSSSTAMTVQAGRQPSGGARGPVIITDTSTNATYGIGGNAWEYYPLINNSHVRPPTGQNGTTVTIDLSSIANLPSVTNVSLTGVPASSSAVSNGVLTVQAGPSPSTPLGDVVIEFAGGIVITILQAWSYQSPVSISNINPTSGYFNTLVTITGNWFQANSVMITAVYLAGVETVIETQFNTQLRVRISRANFSSTDTVGPVTILADSGAFYSSSEQLFTYVGVQVTDVSPQVGTRGTLVTVTGVGLLAGGSSINSVAIAGISASVQAMSSTAVSFIAGPSSSRSNISDITYTMDTQAMIRIPSTWSYTNPGTITSVFPAAGAMGTIVSISGENLLGGGNSVTAVMLNSQITTEILQGFNNFVQVIAAGTTGALQPGSVQVISDTQAITESDNPVQFTYLEPGSVTSITPSMGQNGTNVTIVGTRFHNGESVERVLLAGVEARVISVDTSGMTSTVVVETGRPASSGSFGGPITIFSASNTTTISNQFFTYLSEGIILSVIPNSGRNGTVVTIQGENLLGGGTTVQSLILAGEEAMVIEGSMSEVLVMAPPASNNNSSFSGDIILVSDTNAYVRRVNGWTYTQAGQVSAVEPSQGQYGTFVMVSGQNLLSGGTDVAGLLFDDTALNITSANDTLIIARVEEPATQTPFTTTTISITSDTGGVLNAENTWEFLNQSTITDLDPASGISREEIVITGTNLLGGGQTITSVSIAGIPGVVRGSNDSQVTVVAGVNTNGRMRVGDLVLESDTGAQTIDTWVYDAECPSNSFGTVDNCQPCDSLCDGCVGPTNLDCIACANFSILTNSSSGLQCVESCPGLSTLENVCVDACELYQFEQVDTLINQTFCRNCSSLCDPNLGCTGPETSQCNGCLFFRDVVDQTCVDSCPSDTFFANATNDCVPCHRECASGCFGASEAECNECVNFRVTGLLNSDDDVCRASCPSLFYPDGDFCRPCDLNCVVGCSGPSPFQCQQCRNVFFTNEAGSRMCLPSCNANYYLDGVECKPCSSLCLPGEGCTGPGENDCNVCSLSLDLSSPSSCVESCPDASTYFIRNMTMRSVCVRCHESCGNRGCTEAGPLNCLSSAPFSAGSGTVALVIIIILILVAVIVALVLVLVWRLKGSSFKYQIKLPLIRKERNSEEGQARYTASKTATVQSIPLNSIEKGKASANPLFTEGASDQETFYSEMGPEDQDQTSDILYSEAEAGGNPLPEKNAGLSASQDLYTEMEPILPDRDTKPPPILPPKPSDNIVATDKKIQDKPPVELPPVPTKPEKPLPPGPPDTAVASSAPEGPELYTDMQGGITEVFINTAAEEDVYDNDIPQSPISQIDDTYEDTESALVAVEAYRKSFGAGVKSASMLPRDPPRKSFSDNKRLSTPAFPSQAPALPSQPIPKKRPSLPATPLQKSLSSSSMGSNPTSPTSASASRPVSISSGIPEEECLYDDITTTAAPLVKPAPQKPQPKKKEKAKKKK